MNTDKHTKNRQKVIDKIKENGSTPTHILTHNGHQINLYQRGNVLYTHYYFEVTYYIIYEGNVYDKEGEYIGKVHTTLTTLYHSIDYDI